MFVILFCFILSNYVAYYYLNALSGWGFISTFSQVELVVPDLIRINALSG